MLINTPRIWTLFGIFIILIMSPATLLGEVFPYDNHVMKQIREIKQQEAKVALLGLYSAEMTFFAEYACYSSYLLTMGYLPADGERNYIVGFTKESELSPEREAMLNASYPDWRNSSMNTMGMFIKLMNQSNNQLNFFPNVDPDTGEPTGEYYTFWFNPMDYVTRIPFNLFARWFCGRGGCGATDTGFKAIAIGRIAGRWDIWTINEKRELKNLYNGAR